MSADKQQIEQGEAKQPAPAPPPAVAQKKELAPGTLFGVKPTTFDEAWRFAQMIADSGMAPKQFVNQPKDVMVAMQMGMEIGLAPLAALQNIAVINGRPSLWGDALVGICLAHPDCESIEEKFDHEKMIAFCAVKRTGYPVHVAQFSKQDAEIAGLWPKPGPWKQYPKRMLQNRARAFALRDRFADALRGISVAEEQRDIEMLPGEWEHPSETEAEPAALDSSQQITQALDKEMETAAGAGPEPENPDSGKKSPAKHRGRPLNLDTFKTECETSSDLDAHWQDKRELYQSKLSPAEFTQLSEYMDGLAADRAAG